MSLSPEYSRIPQERAASTVALEALIWFSSILGCLCFVLLLADQTVTLSLSHFDFAEIAPEFLKSAFHTSALLGVYVGGPLASLVAVWLGITGKWRLRSVGYALQLSLLIIADVLALVTVLG